MGPTTLETPCREWQGSKNEKGYGHRNRKQFKTRYVHRQIMAMVHGEDAIEGKNVMHRCDNPSCFRFDHLVIGTALDNTMDMVNKGRHHYAQRTHCANGHEFTEENTRVRKDNGSRRCHQCKYEQNKATPQAKR